MRKIISQVENHLCVKFVDFSTPPQGMDSEVLLAKDNLGKEYAIKYGSNSTNDALALSLLQSSQVGIPIPRVITSFAFEGKSVVVMEKINFPLLQSAEVEEMHLYIPSMISNLNKFHTIKSDEAGSLDQHEGKTWKELILAKFNGENINWQEIAKRKSLDEKLVLKSIEKIVEKIDNAKFISNSYSLIHTDFNQRNLFIDPNSNEITGIIDWSDAIFGDPVYDFARV